MSYVFSILGIIGLLGSGTLLLLIITSDPAATQIYPGDLDTLFLTILVSLVFLAIAKILSQLNDIHERLKERDSAEPPDETKSPLSFNKGLRNWPPS